MRRAMRRRRKPSRFYTFTPRRVMSGSLRAGWRNTYIPSCATPIRLRIWKPRRIGKKPSRSCPANGRRIYCGLRSPRWDIARVKPTSVKTATDMGITAATANGTAIRTADGTPCLCSSACTTRASTRCRPTADVRRGRRI